MFGGSIRCHCRTFCTATKLTLHNNCHLSSNTCLSNILSNSHSIKLLNKQMFPEDELNNEIYEKLTQ